MFSEIQNQSFRKINIFYFLFSVWFVVIGFLVFTVPKHDSFIAVNHARSMFADIFFTIASFNGDFFGVLLISTFCIIKKEYRLLVLVLLGYIFVGLLNSFLKHHFNSPRPLACYGASIVKSAHWMAVDRRYSFPSGHTAIAFCMATILSNHFYNNKQLVALFFLLACCTAYSRLYLGEHFLQDIWVASSIGVICGSILSSRVVANFTSSTILRKQKLQTKELIE